MLDRLAELPVLIRQLPAEHLFRWPYGKLHTKQRMRLCKRQSA